MAIAELIAGFAQWAEATAGAYGYLGIFLVTLIGNLSIVLPVPSFAVVFIFGGLLNPWLVGLFAGLGSALGEITGYAIGIGGRKAILRKYKKQIQRFEKWAHKIGMFPLLVIFGATPLPSDLMGIIAGIVRYDMKKFLLASFIGKAIMNISIAWAGFYGISWVLTYLAAA